MKDTIEIYYQSAYIKEFDATVTGCEKATLEGQNLFLLTLDRTAFFPEQGGQTSDFGILTTEDGVTCSIKNVSIDEDHIIRHLSDTCLEPGTKIHGKIDWEHRFSNMQQHTGEHIFSGIVHSRFGFDNVGFHLSDQEVTMDYNGVLTEADICEIEMLTNRAIWENIDVVCEFPSKEALANIDYRSKKELDGDVRIVSIRGYDACACCAPHVLKTGEIGILKVVGLQNYKKGVRVNILCGKRALEYICAEHTIVSKLSGIFTTSRDNIIASVKRNADEMSKTKAELSETREKLIEAEIKEIDPGLFDVFLIKEQGYDANVMRKTVNALAALHGGFCGVFSGNSQSGYNFVLCSGKEGKDAKQFLEQIKERFEVKGGGSPKMIQGSISCQEEDLLNMIHGL